MNGRSKAQGHEEDSKDRRIDKVCSTAKGARRGCEMGPLVFSLYIAELDRYTRNRRIEDIIRLGEDMITRVGVEVIDSRGRI